MRTPPHLIIPYEELMVEILSWLPVKSLVRLKCVSKSFKSLISHPSFVKLHLQRSPKNANLLLRLNSFDLSCSLSVLKNPSFTIAEDLGFRWYQVKNYRVVGSCNGLICLVAKFSGHSSYKKYYLYDKYQVYLWNPASKLISQQSPALLVAHSKQHGSPITAFGFGYDSSSNTYKVVATILFQPSYQPSYTEVIKVYNKGDNCWRNIQSFPGLRNLKFFEGVYLSGTLSWLAVPSNHYWDFPADLSIVSLDLGKETYRQLLLPCGSDEAHHVDEAPCVDPSLGVLKDCLCFSHDCKQTHFVVWQMKEYGVENSWIQLLKVRYQDLQTDLDDLFCLTPLCTFENGVILAIYAGGYRAVLYNQKDHKVEPTKISKNISWIYAYDYVQSLVSPA